MSTFFFISEMCHHPPLHLMYIYLIFIGDTGEVFLLEFVYSSLQDELLSEKHEKDSSGDMYSICCYSGIFEIGKYKGFLKISKYVNKILRSYSLFV